MFRRRITRSLPSDQLRDYFVGLLRSRELSDHDFEMMERGIKRHWRSDPKRDRRIDRYKKAHDLDRQIAEELANNDTLTVLKAKDNVARRTNHHSGEALDKWLRRNRRLPDLLT